MQVDVHDPEVYETHKQRAPISLAAYGGRYLTRGGPLEVLSGSWPRERTIIVEFALIAAGRAWHESKEYAPARRLRDQAASVNVVIVDGLVDYFYPEDLHEEERAVRTARMWKGAIGLVPGPVVRTIRREQCRYWC